MEMSRDALSEDFNSIVLDDGVGEQLVGRLLQVRLGLGLVGTGKLDVEHFALADAGDALDAKRLQRSLDRLALRVEDAGFQRNGHTRLHVSPSAFHQYRTRTGGPLVLHQDTQTLGDLGIGLQQPAEIPAEAVLVELLVRLDVPQPARIGGDLVGHDDSHHLVFEQSPAFHLEIDQTDADAQKQTGEEVIDADRQRHDVVDLLRGRPAEGRDMLFGDHGIVQLVVLVVKLDDRARQLGAFLDTEALRQRSRRNIPHHHLERDDLDLANQLLTHVETADEMGGNPDVVEVLKQVLRNPVVEDTLALDHLVLLGIERGRIVLEVLDQGTRLRTFVKDLGLAFINAAPTAHWDVP